MFTAVYNALPTIIGTAFLLILLAGFWRGLTLPPHKDGHRPAKWNGWWNGPGP